MKKINIISVIILTTFMSCNFNHLHYFQHLESPDGKYYYGLYSDFSIGDEGFVVLKLEKDINPKELRINNNWKTGIGHEAGQWLAARTILSNYDEASYYTKNPKIEIIKDRYLVFSRGGYMFGLYDIQLEKDTFNNCCPWNDWARETEWKGYYKGQHSDYGLWIEKNIQNKIKNYIITNE